jgi:hypothetical protein
LFQFCTKVLGSTKCGVVTSWQLVKFWDFFGWTRSHNTTHPHQLASQRILIRQRRMDSALWYRCWPYLLIRKWLSFWCKKS